MLRNSNEKNIYISMNFLSLYSQLCNYSGVKIPKGYETKIHVSLGLPNHLLPSRETYRPCFEVE